MHLVRRNLGLQPIYTHLFGNAKLLFFCSQKLVYNIWSNCLLLKEVFGIIFGTFRKNRTQKTQFICIYS